MTHVRTHDVHRQMWLCYAVLVVPAVLSTAPALGQERKVNLLHIGTSGTLAGEAAGKEKSALDSLQGLIKDETGFDNNIVRQKDWVELAQKLTKKELQVGVFQGYEFAWAQQKFPNLKPLALAVNVYRYPVVYVVVKTDSKAKDFSGLNGQTVALPATGQRYLRFFMERQSQALGKDWQAFFSKIVQKENSEDALDDVVDGVVQATAADRATLEAYERRKPSRFKQLRPIAQSQALPPTVIAYSENALDMATLQRFRQGLLDAGEKERGRMLLTMFKLTSFGPVPDDFDKVLAESRKAYPAQ